MEVQVFGTLRLITQEKRIQVDLPAGATLRDLLAEVIRRYPALQVELIDENSALRSDLPLFLNGRNPRLLAEKVDTRLQPGDVLCLFSPISSGRMNVEVLREPASTRRRNSDES